ncbi:hypothetical protein [Paracoccus rhizosphaerae]|uniref:Uncharacterized protein n=1 Tax=Paracoccus rhizosphaerae TaxID=1133347 RepID=A0ABV6CEW0_9RHOB|nr:hypothetical protein [Paracoccus rhizosphaerae]
MQLNDILADSQDQDRGRDFELADPVTGKPVGITLRIAGPDSETQHRARIAFTDELAEASDDYGRVPAVAREKARLNNLARCILGWHILEDGSPVPLNHANALRLLRSALWVQEQVDAFAADRAAFRGTSA